MSMKRLLILGFCLLVAVPGFAIDRVAPGFDTWITRGDGSTYYDFSVHPIPAGFFCKDSEPFTGRIAFEGVPIKGAGGADTLVERIDEAVFDSSGTASTRIQVRGLSLVGTAPISTSCGQFTVRATLSGGVQPLTNMVIRKLEENAGTFESRLALEIKLSFQRVGSSLSDPSLTMEDKIMFNVPTVAPWVALPQNQGGARLAVVDLNGDGKVETRLAGDAVYFAGSTLDDQRIRTTNHCATYDEFGTCTEIHQVEPCECCNLPPGYQCP
jgi:hypothetical protein